jgi:probable addiction module antidote protein
MATKIRPYDASEYLENEEDIKAYLEAVLEDNDPELLYMALGNIARARGMTQIAKEAGVTREALYRSLSETGNPAYSTVSKVINAFGFDLTLKPRVS